MKHLIILYILLLVENTPTFIHAHLITSKNPISLGGLIRARVKVNETTSEVSTVVEQKSVRSRSALFERALDMSPGLPFVFNIDKWRDLQNSGLFYNLSASVFKRKDDSVGVEISGYELPSVRFAPEGKNF